MTSEWLDIYLSNEISTDNPDIPLNDYFNLNGFGSQYLLINLASSVVYMFIYLFALIILFISYIFIGFFNM